MRHVLKRSWSLRWLAYVLSLSSAVLLMPVASAHEIYGSTQSGLASTAVKAGGFIYVSATAGTDPHGRILSDRVDSQTERALANIGASLKQANSTIRDAVSITVYLRRPDDLKTVDTVCAKVWRKDPPARTVLIVTQPFATPNASIEISAIAVPTGTSRSAVQPETWRRPTGPFSYAVKIGNSVFTSGLVSEHGEDSMPGDGDLGAQTKTILDNAGTILKAAGMDYVNVAAARLFFAGENDVAAINTVYNPYFPKLRPARHGVHALMVRPEQRLELSLIAGRSSPGDELVATNGGVRLGDRLYLTGIIAPSPATKGDVRAQTSAVLERATTALKSAGYDWSDVVETVVYLNDMSRIGDMDAVYREVMGDHHPARTVVGMGLINEASIELVVTAVKGH
jgi:2-iminobutanoate/2-iminopropanoate deaminase